jgi:hypothetical protein
VGSEKLNQAELGGGGDGGFVANREPHGRGVNYKITGANDLFFKWSIKAPQYGLHPSDYFFRAEGFGDVVVGADFKAAQAVGFGCTRGDENDRDSGERRIVTDGFGDIEAAVAGNHNVQNDERGTARMHFIQKAGGGRKPGNAIARRLQVMLEQASNIRIVLQNENGRIQRLGHPVFSCPQMSARLRVEHRLLEPRI